MLKITPGPHRKNGNNGFPVYRCNSGETIMVAKSIAKQMLFIHNPTDYIEACRSEEPSTHTFLLQCGFQHRPLLGVLQDQAAAKEVPSQ